MRDGFLYYFLTMLVRRLPMMILALAGIGFAAVRWKLHPRASLITLVALVIYLVDMVVYTIFLFWLPTVIRPMDLSVSGNRMLYSLVYFVEDSVNAVVIFLLVAAAFTGRALKSEAADTPQSA